MIARQFGGDNAWPTVPVDRVLALGAEPESHGGDGEKAVFNMAVMGMRLAQRVNGVSVLHGEVSREMFQGLWPGFDLSEIPIGSITNGVHAPTWVGREVMELAGKELPTLVERRPGLGGRAEALRRRPVDHPRPAPRQPGQRRPQAPS